MKFLKTNRLSSVYTMRKSKLWLLNKTIAIAIRSGNISQTVKIRKSI